MTPEAQRIAIAEACGWKKCQRCDDPWCAYNTPPDYLSDLNAIHAAEKVLGDRLDDYMWHLQKVCQPVGYTYKSAICATAAKRAEAFLRTLNLWTE